MELLPFLSAIIEFRVTHSQEDDVDTRNGGIELVLQARLNALNKGQSSE
jgi:hypothetical protein